MTTPNIRTSVMGARPRHARCLMEKPYRAQPGEGKLDCPVASAENLATGSEKPSTRNGRMGNLGFDVRPGGMEPPLRVTRWERYL